MTDIQKLFKMSFLLLLLPVSMSTSNFAYAEEVAKLSNKTQIVSVFFEICSTDDECRKKYREVPVTKGTSAQLQQRINTFDYCRRSIGNSGVYKKLLEGLSKEDIKHIRGFGCTILTAEEYKEIAEK